MPNSTTYRLVTAYILCPPELCMVFHAVPNSHHRQCTIYKILRDEVGTEFSPPCSFPGQYWAMCHADNMWQFFRAWHQHLWMSNIPGDNHSPYDLVCHIYNTSRAHPSPRCFTLTAQPLQPALSLQCSSSRWRRLISARVTNLGPLSGRMLVRALPCAQAVQQ